jgi:cell division septation protein DedD
MNKRGFAIIFLFLIIAGLSGVAIYVGNQLSQQNTSPEDINAAANRPCTGSCNSGSTCNQYGNPPENKMWACYKNNSGVYQCQFVAINDGGAHCYLSCGGGWKECGCDKAACERKCLSDNKNSGPGHYTLTQTCGGCQQKFTCGCDIEGQPTDTPRPTNTIVINTPTSTPTATPTKPGNTNTPTPTATPTAKPTVTYTPTATPTGTTKPTSTPTATPTRTNTPTPTATGTTRPTNTPTATPTGTQVPTATPTITPTGTLKPTLPKTAITTDKGDRIIIGILLMIIGLITYISNLHNKIGTFFWNIGGKNILPHISPIFKNQSIDEIRNKFEKKIRKDSKEPKD